MSDATSSASIASASELTVCYSTHSVLDGLTAAIHQGDRIGLVGRNGCGKSTFLRIAAGESEPDSGLFVTRKGLITGYLPQKFELDPAKDVLSNIMDGARWIQELIETYENTPAESAQSAELLDQINQLDGWTLEQRAQGLITNLHAPEGHLDISRLSGGEKRRVALCRALISKPDFLILDEPTNHLDTESIEWLEQFLARYKGTCLFVTHDRYFLDRISTSILEISQGKAYSYEGNYTDYMLTRAERMANEQRTEHKRQRFLQKELEWVRRRPKARGTKSRDRLDRYFEVKDQDGPEKELEVDLIIPPAPKLSNRVIELNQVGKQIGDRRLFHKLDFKLEGGERVGIVGRNGMGKSTLLRVILGKEPASSGEVLLGSRAEINYVDQDRLNLDDNLSVFEEVGEGQEYVTLGEEKIGLRAYLRRFLFSDERINTKIELLSGGERSRVLLAKILKKGGNILVLDEPTNDLDLNTLRLLEEALLGFQGSVLVVSHDRYFLNRVCTGILAFEDDGGLHYSPGSYDYYLEKKAERDKQTAPPKKESTKTPEKAKRPRKLKWAEQRELETIEEVILEAEEIASALETEMSEPDFYTQHTHDWQEYEEKRASARQKVSDLYDRWEELEAIKQASEVSS